MNHVKKIEAKDSARLALETMFEGIEDSMVTAYLQGHMGAAYVASEEHPAAAVLISGEYSFWGGDSDSADADVLIGRFFELCESESSTGIYAVRDAIGEGADVNGVAEDAYAEAIEDIGGGASRRFQNNPAWERALLAHPENHPVMVLRHRIAQKDYDFDPALLRKYIDALPPGFRIVRFDRELYGAAMSADWSKEFCEGFGSAEDFLTRGFGFAVLKGDEFVSGISTQTVYDGGAEIQIATREDFRRQGLALPCAAAMIKECAARGLRPCWDAANEASRRIALKLGYEYEGVYTTVHLSR